MTQSIEATPSRRRAIRRSVTLACDVVASAWDVPKTHAVSDLSPYGCWIDTPTPLPPETHVVVAFRPPRWEGAEVAPFARVTHAVRSGARRGMGLEFLDVPADVQEVIAESLRGLPPPLAISRLNDERKPVWVDTHQTYREDLGDRVNIVTVEKALGMVASGDRGDAAA